MTKTRLKGVLTRCLTATALATMLSGCMVSGPLSLLSAADKLFIQNDAQSAAPAGPISIQRMLAKARQSGSGETAEEHSPVATIERSANGLDGPAYSALGAFLSDLAPMSAAEVLITRPPADTASSLEDARFALRVGKLVEDAGHRVRFNTSPVQENGTVFLSVAQEG